MNETFCKCGCGTRIASHSSWARGHNAKRGNPVELAAMVPPNPSGRCECGCGQLTTIAEQTSTHTGAVKGEPLRFVTGHNSKYLTGPARRHWKGGRIVTSEGYVRVRVGPVGDRSYRLEHRVVMEAVLGRPLKAHEQVHHINGVKTDNRPENLELWQRSQPSGIRSGDYHCPGCCCPT